MHSARRAKQKYLRIAYICLLFVKDTCAGIRRMFHEVYYFTSTIEFRSQTIRTNRMHYVVYGLIR